MSSERVKQVILIVFVIGPLVATAYAMYTLWEEWISWTELGLFLAFYFLTGLGITIGFHRLLTHRSFEVGPMLKATFLILGSMAVQGRAIDWAANHLKHHAFSDQEGDPQYPLEKGFVQYIQWYKKLAADQPELFREE